MNREADEQKPHQVDSNPMLKFRQGLTIFNSEIAGPFDLLCSMKSGQTFGPQWHLEDQTISHIITIEHRPIICGFTNVGDTHTPMLKVTTQSESPLDQRYLSHLGKRICNMLHLQDDLPDFYQKYWHDALSTAFRRYEGLRLVTSDDPFESLISSICSQNTSAKAWNIMVQSLSMRFGRRVTTADGVCFIFPPARALSEASIEDLRKCRTGYRAEYIKEVSRTVAEGILSLQQLKRLPYDEAKSRLVELPGVGEKVADCFLLYGLGFQQAAPVDIWIERIVRRFYPEYSEDLSRKALGRFLRERFGEWAGYAQLYLFHYARSTSTHSCRRNLREPLSTPLELS